MRTLDRLLKCLWIRPRPGNVQNALANQFFWIVAENSEDVSFRQENFERLDTNHQLSH